MGYKLAGYNHIGGVELDPSVAEIYRLNHHPQYLYNEDIREFNNRTDLPPDLFNLDILDGSPPCSTFSKSGLREKGWGKKKHFAEGQKLQRLDDLVFVYCETIAKLRPKVCILENVAGLIQGNSKVYAKEIARRLHDIGYNVQVFLLNASTMGVPQRRERVFFIGLRNDYHLPKLVLDFDETPITYGMIEDDDCSNKVTPCDDKVFDLIPPGYNFDHYKPHWRFDSTKLRPDTVPATLTAGGRLYHYRLHKGISDREICLIGSFPLDYNFGSKNRQWFVGMSVPPVMMAQISHQIHQQWLSKINT